MQILGDSNAVLKDLTAIAEEEIMDVGEPLYPQLCSMIDSVDEAYIKIPIQTKAEFPVLFTGEREDTSTDVNVISTYNKATYALTLDYNADLMQESKAYTFAEKTREGTISAKIFPSYNLTKNIIIANPNAYDGVAFYGTGHSWAKAGANLFNNTASSTGQTPTALYNDLQTAVALMKTFLDDKGRLLNPMVKYGEDQLIIHCPAALEVAFRQVIFGSLIPISIPGSATSAMVATGGKDLGLQGIARLVVDGYLDATSKTQWYLHYVGMPQKPFVYGESYGLRARALGYGTEFQTNTNKVRIALQHRFVEGVYRMDRSIRIG